MSEPTASVVLNDARSGTRVSPKTRLAVTEAARRLGYRPNALAQSLQTGRTDRLGIFSGVARFDSRNAFFAELLGGLVQGCAEHSLNAVIHSSGSSDTKLLDLVSNRAIDGLVVHAGQQSPLLKILHELRVPAIAIADRIAELPSVSVDDATGGALQVHHLCSLGHREVIYKRALEPLPSAQVRADAFCSLARKQGINVTESVTRGFEGYPVLTSVDLELITRSKNPATAIVAYCDFFAELICQELVDLGIEIPGRVAVLGFDGIESAFRRRFELTTIRAPWADVGRTAISLLVALGQGQSVPDVTSLPVAFVRGNTS